jgi:hypothetical protein
MVSCNLLLESKHKNCARKEDSHTKSEILLKSMFSWLERNDFVEAL